MKKYLLTIAALWNLGMNAQSVQLSWKGAELYDTGMPEEMYIPKLENLNSVLYNGTLFLNFTREIKNATVSNTVWEEIQEKDLYGISLGAVPTREIVEVSEVKKQKQEDVEKTRFLISSLKQENGKLYRLKSFVITTGNPQRVSSRINTASATTNNPLATGSFYKIKVDKSGIFKITYQFLRANGINPSSINPQNFRIYGNGGVMLPEYSSDFRYPALQENAIQVVGGEDGSWDEGDYALFYAQGPDGFNLYTNSLGYNAYKRRETRTDNNLNLKNVYEDVSYYFINFDLGAGKRIQLSDVAAPAQLIDSYDAYQFINEEKNNIMKVGRIWVGDVISGTRTIDFPTASPLPANAEVKVNARVVGYNANSTSINVAVNGNVETLSLSPSASSFELRYLKKNYNNISGNKISLSFTPDLATNPTGLYYFDYAEVVYPQTLSFNNSQMNFRKYSISDSGLYGFKLGNTTGLDAVWDVSDPTNAKKVVNKSSSNDFVFGYQYDANSSFGNEFVAFNSQAAYEPGFVGRIGNQNLAAMSPDYLIITRQDMMAEANRLANYYKTQNAYEVEMVTPEQIYNEYSSGGQDITAIRDFITQLYQKGRLKYVLILGDSSYDFKNRISNNTNVVPSYQSEYSADFENSYVTDDYFGLTELNTMISSVLPSLPIGRLPAANVAEAKALVDKTLAYYNALPGQSNPFGDWRLKTTFVVDDDNGGGVPFHTSMNTVIDQNFGLTSAIPEYHVKKLYLDAFSLESTAGGARYPLVTQGINTSMNNGLYLYYFGHGGINGWSQRRVLTTSEIQKFTNFNNAYSRFPLVSTITCEFTLWDDPQMLSAGEMLMKLKSGGPATMITSSRALPVSYGRNFTGSFIKEMFDLDANSQFYPLGDAFLKAKNDYGVSTDHLKVNFLGDPAMKLSRPKAYIRDVKIKNKEGAESSDISNFQIKALDFITITGNVTSDGSTLDENFNGRVTVNIYDKILTKETKNNNGKLKPILSFKEENNPIARVTGTVKDGKFTAQFYIPKDINYTVGEGRVLLYAENWKSANDRSYDVFYSSNIKVGGVNPNGINDSQAPKVKLFMNNTNFADGGITNQNPTLLACVTDDTGINTSGSGIGHDITAVLDGKVLETYVLNDFYTSGEGNGCIAGDLEDFQKGSVSFPFTNLEPGAHQLTFKIWDINNNSTTQTLNFIVKDEEDQKLTIKKLLNWPNPFTNKTYIHFEHNCDGVLEVNAQIYTITGKLVKNIRTIVSAEPFREGFRTPKTAIEWDGLDDYGDAVGKGTYIFKVFVKAQDQERCKGTATQVEKMVLLK